MPAEPPNLAVESLCFAEVVVVVVGVAVVVEEWVHRYDSFDDGVRHRRIRRRYTLCAPLQRAVHALFHCRMHDE